MSDIFCGPQEVSEKAKFECESRIGESIDGLKPPPPSNF